MKLASDTQLPTGWADSRMRPAEVALTCRDCGGSFSSSEHERRAFAALGHHHPPSRCSACRATRKSRQVDSRTAAVGPGFRELRQTQTTVICTACGEAAVVPFAARAGRSVYCSACYERRRVEGNRG